MREIHCIINTVDFFLIVFYLFYKVVVILSNTLYNISIVIKKFMRGKEYVTETTEIIKT